MIYSLFKYLKYLYYSKNILRIHSPFCYDFYKKILKKESNKKLKQIELLRNYYLHENFLIKNEDYGAGSNKNKKNISTKYLIKNVSSTKKYGKLLHHLVVHFKPKNILELGTNIGIGTAYLGLNNQHEKIVTIEGNKEMSSLAEKTLKKFTFKNITFINGKFDDCLEDIFKTNKPFDLIYIDGNHTKKATLGYFNTIKEYTNKDSVVIFDDIYWSKDMTSAWEEIIKDKKVSLSIDLFKYGIIFFREENFEKEHYILWY